MTCPVRSQNVVPSAALEALRPEQGGQDHPLELKIQAARGLGVGRHFSNGIYGAWVGKGHWLVSEPLARGYGPATLL